MAECDRCSELGVSWAIRSPGELRKAIRVVASKVDDGTLLEGPGPSSFESLRSGDGLPDVVYHAFRCADCGAAFTLSAETYHGSGGYWKRD